MNVEYFAFYRKSNGRHTPEIFNRMKRIPEKRLDGSPSMVVTSQPWQLFIILISNYCWSHSDLKCRLNLTWRNSYESRWILTYVTSVASVDTRTPTCGMWPQYWRHWRRPIEAFMGRRSNLPGSGAHISGLAARLTSGKKHSLFNHKSLN